MVFLEADLAVRRFRELVDRYYFDAKSDDDRAVITNISGLVRELQGVHAWYSRELDHWARAARDAEGERDEALRLLLLAEARVEEYEAHRCGGAA